MDIVGGVVGTLCEVLREGVVKGPDGIRVNLLFDQNTPDARVQTGESSGPGEHYDQALGAAMDQVAGSG